MVWKRRSHPTIPLGSGGSSRRAADLRKKCKAKDSAKLVLSLDLVTIFHNTIIFVRYHFGLTFSRNTTKPLIRSFPTTPPVRRRFQLTWGRIWRFRVCLRYSPNRKKPSNWLQETRWSIDCRKECLLFRRWIKKTGKMRSWLVFTTWISWILTFTIRFRQCCY